MHNLFGEYLDIYQEARERAFEEPNWFFKNVLHYKPLKWQLEAIEAVFDVRRKSLGIPTKYNHEGKPRITIRSCHGTGKTQYLSLLMHIWNFVFFGKIACTAPKEAQLTKRLLPRYRSCMRNADINYKNNIVVQGREIRIFKDPDWGANMETASDPDNLAGYHDAPQLFLIDEASAKRLETMFPVIEGALTTPGSVAVEIGNPTRIEGEFYNHHTRKELSSLYYRLHIKHTDAPGLISKQWINAMKLKYGEDSPIFLIRCLGEFSAYDEYILFSAEHIEDAFDTEEEPDGSYPTLKVSVDVSDGGADSTVITVAREYESFTQVLKQKSFNFPPSVAIPRAAKAAITMFEAFNGRKNFDQFIVDSIGVGAGVAGNLMDGGYNVIRNVGGEASDDPDKYRNRRVQNYISLNEAYIKGTVRFSPEAFDTAEEQEELRAHLLSIKRNDKNMKVDDIEPKNKIKEDGLPSPDRADSLAQLFNGKLPEQGLGNTESELIGDSMISSYDGGIAE